jgi:hypothetical protein
MHTKDDVAQLVAQIGELKIDPPVEIETSMFGLAAHLFDPITGQITTLAQPHNLPSAHAEVFLTPKQASAAVAASRAHHLHVIRGLGFANLEAWNEDVKRKAVARDLAHKQEIERTKLADEQSEATAKAAAENEPNKDAREDARKKWDSDVKAREELSTSQQAKDQKQAEINRVEPISGEKAAAFQAAAAKPAPRVEP